MARIQPVLTDAENALVDQMASLTRRHRPGVRRALQVRPRTRSSIRSSGSIAPPRPVTRTPGMSPRASTLRTPALLATPSRAEAIGPASPPVGRRVTSHEHTPGVSGERPSSENRAQRSVTTKAGQARQLSGRPASLGRYTQGGEGEQFLDWLPWTACAFSRAAYTGE